MYRNYGPKAVTVLLPSPPTREMNVCRGYVITAQLLTSLPVLVWRQGGEGEVWIHRGIRGSSLSLLMMHLPSSSRQALYALSSLARNNVEAQSRLAQALGDSATFAVDARTGLPLDTAVAEDLRSSEAGEGGGGGITLEAEKLRVESMTVFERVLRLRCGVEDGVEESGCI